ncbi:hypothetical protein [Spongiactinospora sp. TRM90649]|uniref:hypothetical protein n=1 Tax=Spongiactinospora sp. TRM90649 TaxID=3031114 RepID=UPI0023FA3A9A|nr:hypothetical protein [Spongiactinospora sp. TRM90649]MDF5753810.1 hypothetical protein [Spongiactinospora sp. TRM90649]
MDHHDGPGDELHDELERALREAALAMDPVPPEAYRIAVESFAWRTAEAELAELVFDSSAAAELVRGSSRPHLFTFQASALSVEVEITGSGAARRLVGQLVPPGPAEVEIRSRESVRKVRADRLGRFAAPLPGDGPVSLCCHPEGTDVPVVTEWVTP